MIDNTPPTLTALDLPDVIDLSGGNAVLTAFADATDDLAGVSSIVVWFDREISYSFSSTSTDFRPWSLMIVPDETSIQRLISGVNNPGIYTIDRVTVEDAQGNTRTYSTSELTALGFNTEIELVGSTPDTTPPTLIALDVPDRIDLSGGNAVLTAFADATDDLAGVSSIVVWFDREISYSFSSTSTDFRPWSLMIVPDETSIQRLISGVNNPGLYTIERVSVEDAQGNTRTYS
ncbi:hypothetical protein, partial [Ruegeria sp. PrR005]|uniref:hypothetical protein n=1 Tax=Ruegeria sp. PrR005 TaxID=2706882 RepID=UPI001941E9CC